MHTCPSVMGFRAASQLHISMFCVLLQFQDYSRLHCVPTYMVSSKSICMSRKRCKSLRTNFAYLHTHGLKLCLTSYNSLEKISNDLSKTSNHMKTIHKKWISITKVKHNQPHVVTYWERTLSFIIKIDINAIFNLIFYLISN